MALTVRTEETHTFEGLMAELPGGMSRMKVTAVANVANPILQPGTVMAIITAGGNWTIHDNALSNGAENPTGILLTRVDSVTGEDALVINHDATFNAAHLHFAVGMDGTEQATALGTLRNTADIRIDGQS